MNSDLSENSNYSKAFSCAESFASVGLLCGVYFGLYIVDVTFNINVISSKAISVFGLPEIYRIYDLVFIGIITFINQRIVQSTYMQNANHPKPVLATIFAGCIWGLIMLVVMLVIKNATLTFCITCLISGVFFFIGSVMNENYGYKAGILLASTFLIWSNIIIGIGLLPTLLVVAVIYIVLACVKILKKSDFQIVGSRAS